MKNNKQQTTLQTLIDGLIVRKENIIKNADSMPNYMLEGGVMAFESAIDLAQSLLEMEKELMKGVYVEGSFAKMRYYDGLEYIDADQYYQQTYGGDKL